MAASYFLDRQAELLARVRAELDLHGLQSGAVSEEAERLALRNLLEDLDAVVLGLRELSRLWPPAVSP